MLPGTVIASDGYYVAPIVYPADLTGHLNPTGMVPVELLTDVAGPGRLHHLTARKWNALVAAAGHDGFTLTYSGQQACLRTLVEQTALWHLRCTTTYLPGRPYRVWNGQTWYLIPGFAWPARPGESNHGLGLAIDAALYNWSAQPSTALTGPALAWLKAHAWLFGFTWEYHDAPQPEPWHVRDVTGDTIPDAVLAYERGGQPPPPTGGAQLAKIIRWSTAPNTWHVTDGITTTPLPNYQAADFLVANNLAEYGPPANDASKVLVVANPPTFRYVPVWVRVFVPWIKDA